MPNPTPWILNPDPAVDSDVESVAAPRVDVYLPTLAVPGFWLTSATPMGALLAHCVWRLPLQEMYNP